MDLPSDGKPIPGDPRFSRLREAVCQGRRIPRSTYRLQFHRGFNFQQARESVSYLARLGITDCYCSPYLKARPDSTHGYDICDHSQLNPELGEAADYEAFCAELAAHRMGQILDFVPNHMGVGDPQMNRWWWDVLENGPCSPFARFFDIDWDPVKPELKGKVLLPILGDQYGDVLERGELQLGLSEGALYLSYSNHRLPINPRQAPRVLRHGLSVLQEELGEDQPQLREYLSILTELQNLPTILETEPERVAERQREKEVARERLARLADQSARIRRHIEEGLAAFNGLVERPESFDALHQLLEVQAYRLAYWRTAFHEINYRRFFDINALASLRMEDPAVFAATHSLVLQLIREGKVTGLRLDHVDGLFDPAGYLEKLQDAVLQERAAAVFARDGQQTEELRRTIGHWREVERRNEPAGAAACPLYLVAEKILSAGEALPESWPLHGTTGYDFLNDVNRLLVNTKKMKFLQKLYERFTGRRVAFDDVVYDSEKLVLLTALSSELNVLAHALNRISEKDRRCRDFTLNSLREALLEVVACFPVYRTYVSSSGWGDFDRKAIETALARARRRNPAMEASIFDFVRDVLLPVRSDGLSEAQYAERLEFSMKFQQLTAPVQAKGVEDTAFYRYNLLLSLNEVGGEPERWGSTPAEFHEANLRRLRGWPAGMLASASHDTKRGEDARARLNVLSENPEEWGKAVFRWSRLNAQHRTLLDGDWAPDRNDEWLFYQSLLGAWPAGETEGAVVTSRLRDYMLKAIKEAKTHTSWINPNRAYEQAVSDFVERTLSSQKFLAAFLPFQQSIARVGMVNSLSQLLLKITSPGVPDFYQGSEIWDLTLVDPDNRRPVDYRLRARLLEQMEPLLDLRGPAEKRVAALSAMLASWPDGRIKLFITALGLRLRRQYPEPFLEGDYLPLYAEEARADQLVAFARRLREREEALLAIVPRRVSQLTGPDHPLPVGAKSWSTARLLLPPELVNLAYQNVLTGEFLRPVAHHGQWGIPLAEILQACPVALLHAGASSRH